MALALLSGAAGAQGAGFCAPPADRDRVTAVSVEGELALASGAQTRLADIRLPDDASYRADALGWLKRYEQGDAHVALGAPDRWGRSPARVAVTGADLARSLVERGLALVDAGESQRLCEPDLLRLESQARAKKQGLWAEEANWPVRAEDEARLRERIGRFVLVEGRILSVGERGQRTYLNFGRNFTQDFTITIPKRSWAIMKDRGLSAASLRGRRVRARGLLEAWNGTALTIEVPDLFEVLD
jgi:endonuclease YncB( thermonuclease family)